MNEIELTLAHIRERYAAGQPATVYSTKSLLDVSEDRARRLLDGLVTSGRAVRRATLPHGYVPPPRTDD